MASADLIAKIKYENELTELLLSEEALMLLDPNAIKFEMAYYEHGFDRITFIIKGLEYSIPGCIPTLPTLYFIGFNRVTASEIFAKFQRTTFDESSDSVVSTFKIIITEYLYQKFHNIQEVVVNPKTTREALDYIGISDEAQTNLLKLKFPLQHRAEFMIRQLVIGDAAKWVFRYICRRWNLLTSLDNEIKKRDKKNNGGIFTPIDLQFLAEEIENKYMDSYLAFVNECSDQLPTKFITDP